MSNRLRSAVERLFFGTLLLAGALPLIVTPGLAHPFFTPKELLLRLIVAVAAPLAVVLWFLEGRRLRLGFFGWSVVGLLVAALLSTVFSVDPSTSFWGYAERLGGLLTITMFVLFGWFLTRLFAAPARRRIFLLVWFSVWGLIALFALVERVLPGFWAQFHGDGKRSVATFGNPIFLADGLIIAFATFAATVLAGSRQQWFKLGAAAAIVGLAIVFTETRGAYLGSLVGLLVALGLAALWSPRRGIRRAALLLPLLALAAMIFVWSNRDAVWAKQNHLMERVVSVLHSNDPSRVQRRELWGMALEAIRSRPIVGWGLENFDTAVDRLYNPNFTRYTVSNSFSDRAHNMFLDVAATAGLLGLAAYLFFLTAVFRRILMARRSGNLSNSSAAAAVGGLAGYLAANLTSFDTAATWMGLAVGAALLASLVPQPPMEHPRPPRRRTVVLALSSTVIFSVGLLIFGAVPLARGARIVHRAVTASDGSELLAAAGDLPTFWNPYRPHEAHRIASQIFKEVGNNTAFGQPPDELLRAAEKLLTDAVARRPEHFGTRFTLANIYLLQAMRGTRPYSDAKQTLEEARLLSPRRQMVDFQLGNIYLLEKQPDAAVQVFRRALELDPTIAEAHWHLARGLAAAGQTKEAAAEFVAALKGLGGGRPEPEIALAINTMLKAGDLVTVRRLYFILIQRDPDNVKNYTAFAAASAALDDRNNTLAALQRAIALDPSVLREVPAFLQTYHLPPDFLTSATTTPEIHI